MIRLFNINDSQVNCDKFVRLEFYPDEIKDLPNIEKYKLRIDEGCTPDWFDQYREFIIIKLKEFISKRIITSDQKILVGGFYVVKDCIIDKLINAQVVYLQGQVNEMSGNATVQRMSGNATVNEMSENATVQRMSGNATAPRKPKIQ